MYHRNQATVRLVAISQACGIVMELLLCCFAAVMHACMVQETTYLILKFEIEFIVAVEVLFRFD